MRTFGTVFFATTFVTSMLVSPALAGEPTLRTVRLCDTSGCYLANLVVDSDQDGVCDADEQMAGTDPFDPSSKPSLLVITELARHGELPSFQSQLGQFVVYSEAQQYEIQMLTGLAGFEVQDLVLTGLAGFEIQDLMLTGFEIQDLMVLAGFEIQDFEIQDWKIAHEGEEGLLVAFPVGERADGLAALGISLDTLAEHGIDPERDGLTVSLEKGEDPKVPARRVGGLDVRLISADEEPMELSPLDPKAGNHGDVEHQYVIDGGIALVYADGVTYVSYDDGSGFTYDADYNILGWWYTNPDADASAVEATPEQLEAWARIADSAVNTVQGWSLPGVDGMPEDKSDLVVLIDPQHSENPAFLSTDPELYRAAQPEPAPGLPSPLEAGDPTGSACVLGCPQ